jgi:hypothetical protein
MSAKTASEKLFEEFCGLNGIPCSRVAPAAVRTPDFVIELGGTQATCEVKQIDPNDEDLQELAELRKGVGTGRYLPNRLRAKLKNVSTQLKNASESGRPTLLVVYDNTPFKSYTDHADVVQAMFGRNSVSVLMPTDPSLPPKVSDPFFGGDRGMGPERNTALSAIAILDGGPRPPLTMRVYHNPYAAVRLDPAVFNSLPATQRVLPDSTEVSL